MTPTNVAPTRQQNEEELSEDSPAPNLDEAVRFLDALGGPDSAWTFMALPEKGGGVDVLHGAFGQHADRLKALDERGAGIFVTVNETDLKGRKTANIIRVRAVFGDFDDPTTDPFRSLAEAGLEPHIEVESSPGKAHAYWLVANFALAEFAPLQVGLIDRLGSDPACKDLPRMMRLPGFIHWKSRPFRSRIVTIRHHAAYTVEQIRRWLIGDAMKVAAAEAQPSALGTGRPVLPATLHDALLGVEQGERDQYLFRLACRFRAQDFDYEEALQLMREAASRCRPPFPEAEAVKKLDQAWKYPAGPSIEKLTDVGNAKRLVARYGSLIIWVIEFKKWLIWKGDHWVLDLADEIMQVAKALSFEIYAEAAKVTDSAYAKAISNHATNTQQLRRLRAMIELARSEPGVFVGQNSLDADPMVLGALDVPP